MNTTLLEARSIAKHFGGVKALSNVSLTIKQGEIYGLIGDRAKWRGQDNFL